MSKRVQHTIDANGIACIHMADTEGKNIFSHEFVEDFVAELDAVEAASPKVMVIRGLPDVFSGGADKDSLMGLANGEIVVRDLIISERLVNTEFPVIAAMEGHAMGGGLAIGLCSDIIIAARESRYGAVFITMGFTPGMGTTTLLPPLVGDFIAAEMMYTGKRFKGRELAEKGCAFNYILPKAEVFPKAMDIALQIAERNPKSIALLKYTLSAPKRKMLVDARLQEDLMHTISFGYPETKKTIENFYAGS